MKNVLIITPSLKSGGTENHIAKIIIGLDCFARTTVLCMNEDDVNTSVSKKLSAAGSIILYYKIGFSNLKRSYQAIRFLKKNEYDLVHSFVYQKHFFELLILLFIKYKKYITERRNIQHWRGNKKIKYIERLRNWLTDLVVCNSCAVLQIVRKFEDIPIEKIVVIKNGVNIQPLDDFHRLASKRAEDFNRLYITTVANIKPNKNIFTVVRALSGLSEALKKRIVYRVVGAVQDFQYFEKIKAYTMNNNISVEFLGEVDNLHDIYATSHLFILLSFAEGSPNSAIEASSYGVPLLLSGVGGNVELVNCIGGRLVDPYNVELAASEIESMFNTYQDWECLQNLTYYNSAIYSMQTMLEAYRSIYENI